METNLWKGTCTALAERKTANIANLPDTKGNTPMLHYKFHSLAEHAKSKRISKKQVGI